MWVALDDITSKYSLLYKKTPYTGDLVNFELKKQVFSLKNNQTGNIKFSGRLCSPLYLIILQLTTQKSHLVSEEQFWHHLFHYRCFIFITIQGPLRTDNGKHDARIWNLRKQFFLYNWVKKNYVQRNFNEVHPILKSVKLNNTIHFLGLQYILETPFKMKLWLAIIQNTTKCPLSLLYSWWKTFLGNPTKTIWWTEIGRHFYLRKNSFKTWNEYFIIKYNVFSMYIHNYDSLI